MKGWIARDFDPDGVYFYKYKPVRDNYYKEWNPDPDKLGALWLALDKELLPINVLNLKWEDEPIEAELFLTVEI